MRETEIESEKLKLHKDKFNQDMSVGVVTLAEVLSVEPENNKATLASSHSAKASRDETAGAVSEDKVWKLKKVRRSRYNRRKNNSRI